MRIDVLTIFPEAIEPFVKSSIIGRAQTAGLVQIHLTNIRDYAEPPHRKVDDTPYGGGPGMVMMCGPLFAAVEAVEQQVAVAPRRIILSPQGQLLNQPLAEQLARLERLLLICGHYEGLDERISQGLGAEEISIGDFILSGGESAAMVLIDAVVRLLPGALGDEQSARDESFGGGLLEYPQYTRPREFRGMAVPEILLSGHHAQIDAWRRAEARSRTQRKRPDLYRQHLLESESSHDQSNPPTAGKEISQDQSADFPDR
ncbi:MAG: tRNA (guanine-N(1)-)-methyltransferase [Phycisphaerae bacterium]|nr:tRNA (guanine-N(1)-)-methyltransferase [Phycisphaerae bacterium]